jgi:hypothetical protein
MIHEYRRLDPEAREMLRVMFERLAASTTTEVRLEGGLRDGK